jgi:hypothetical protein
VYTGQFQDMKPHGHGLLKYPDGGVYEGDFFRGKRQSRAGAGVSGLTDADLQVNMHSHTMQSILRLGITNQYSTPELALTHLLIYSPTLSLTHYSALTTTLTHPLLAQADESFTGSSTVRFTTGDRFEGTYVEGKAEGFGTMTYSNGDIYQGHWVAGEKHGTGVYKVDHQHSLSHSLLTYSHQLTNSHTLTHSFTHSLTLTNSLTDSHSPIQSLIHSLTDSLTDSLTH